MLKLIIILIIFSFSANAHHGKPDNYYDCVLVARGILDGNFSGADGKLGSEEGNFKAPMEKDNSKNYRWLCVEHIKLFNKSWDYFDGMNQNEIENFLKSDMTWHRPTQKFSSSDNFCLSLSACNAASSAIFASN